MRVYEDIKNMLCDELEEIAKKKELTSSSLDVLDKAIDVIKDISTIEAMEQEFGYSQEGGSSREGGYSQGYFGRMPFYMYDESYEGGSYARGRGRNANRDSRGRYSSEGYSQGDYSRNEGYSREGMKDELRMMMDRARTDKEREALRKAMDSM